MAQDASHAGHPSTATEGGTVPEGGQAPLRPAEVPATCTPLHLCVKAHYFHFIFLLILILFPLIFFF